MANNQYLNHTGADDHGNYHLLSAMLVINPAAGFLIAGGEVGESSCSWPFLFVTGSVMCAFWHPCLAGHSGI